MRKQYVAIALVVIVVGSVTAYSGSIVLETTVCEKQFEWAVQVGDVFVVSANLTYKGEDWYFDYYEFSGSILEEITVTLFSLQTLVNSIDGESFVESIVLPTKTTCNNTGDLDSYRDIITDLTSMMIIPTGEWDWFDTAFADEPSSEVLQTDDVDECYSAKIEGDIFHFQWTIAKSYFPNGAVWRYIVRIDMNTGLPVSAIFSYGMALYMSWESYRLELSVLSYN